MEPADEEAHAGLIHLNVSSASAGWRRDRINRCAKRYVTWTPRLTSEAELQQAPICYQKPNNQDEPHP